MDIRDLWSCLEATAPTQNPWLIGGDFNIVHVANERLGGNPIDFNAASEFNDIISRSGLVEFNCLGSSFTWKKSGHRMWQKLDRCLANTQWKMVFSNSVTKHLNRDQSDHAPLVGVFKEEHARHIGCFKFQQMWIRHHQFQSIVKQSWDSQLNRDALTIFAQKLLSV